MTILIHTQVINGQIEISGSINNVRIEKYDQFKVNINEANTPENIKAVIFLQNTVESIKKIIK